MKLKEENKIRESLNNISDIEEKSREVVDPAFAKAVKEIKSHDEERDNATKLMAAPKQGEESLSKDFKFTLDESLFKEDIEDTYECFRVYIVDSNGEETFEDFEDEDAARDYFDKEVLSLNNNEINLLHYVEDDPYATEIIDHWDIDEAEKVDESKKITEDVEEKVIVHLLPEGAQESYAQDYWDYLLEDDGLYGKDGKNGIVIMDSRGDNIYENYTQFSNDEILNSEYDTIEEALTNLTGKNYIKFTDTGYSQGDYFECYYPAAEFSKEWLQELADNALGKVTIYEVQNNDDFKYDTIIGNTVQVFDSLNKSDKEQIADVLGVKLENIIIKKPVVRYDYEEDLKEDLNEDNLDIEEYLNDIRMGEGWVTVEKIEFDIEEAPYNFKAEDVITYALNNGWKLKTLVDGLSLVQK